jgi:UDP-N-acetylmuramoyl-tripeptide--D-alanyl-D-alanine ligase
LEYPKGTFFVIKTMKMSIETLYDIYQEHPEICTDSRKVSKGALFFALKGENFDGNKFAAAALEQGAAYAVIDDPQFEEDDRCILVEDVLKTLQALARYHRDQFSIPVLGLTGSNGKTTSKELIAAVLSKNYKVHATRGNYNNHIGVPLTLLAMPGDTEIAVIEMGANGLKEIGFLCAISAPTHGFVTNIGKAHLEGFGSVEGIIITKAEIYDWLAAHDGVGFVNQNEAHLEKMATGVKQRVFYGKDEAIQLTGDSPFVEISITKETGKIPVKTKLIGGYNFNNLLTAITIGRYFGVADEAIKEALESYQPSNNRSQLMEKDGNTFIMDAYNANPDSMEKALVSFSGMDRKGRQKIAIIGDMLELGENSESEHRKIVELLDNLDIDNTIFIGPEFGRIVQGSNCLQFDVAEAARDWFVDQDFYGALILLKGSRGIRLEEVIK